MTNSEEKYGPKIEYDPLWKGPMQNSRFVTDKIWLIIFIIFVPLYISTGMYGLIIGNLDSLAAPMDYADRACGIDSEVAHKPYLFFLDLKNCTGSDGLCLSPSVCVSKCPTDNFIYKRGSSNDSIDQIKEKLICTTDVDTSSISTFDQIEILISNKKCSKWYLKSEPKSGTCLAFNAWEGHENETLTSDDLYTVRKNIREQEYFFIKIYNDINDIISPCIVAIICGGIIALIYVVLLKWLAVPFFYASICMFCTVIMYGIYYLSVEYYKNRRGQALFGLILLILLIVGTIIAVVHFRKKIYLACQLVKESSKAVMHLSITLVFSILPWILYIIVITFSAFVFMSLLTITEPNYKIEKLDDGNADGCQCSSDIKTIFYDGAHCDPTVFDNECKAYNGQPCQFMQCRLESQTNPNYLYIFHSINFIGFYWILFFISGFEYMVLGGTFASWYWTYNKNNVYNHMIIKSTATTLRYHLGSIAFGSFILTIAQIIRYIFQGFQNFFRQTNNACAGGIFCCFRYFFELLDSFLNFLSYNAYVMCAIHGKNFCQSAKDAFNLIMRNVVKVVVVDTVAEWLFIMAKLLVTSIAVIGIACYFMYSQPEDSEDMLEISIIITAIGTYTIASVFFSVQSIAVNTIFLCFIEDSERNDGSDERPYYMSNKLKKLQHK